MHSMPKARFKPTTHQTTPCNHCCQEKTYQSNAVADGVPQGVDVGRGLLEGVVF